jgi:hypothetical protein
MIRSVREVTNMKRRILTPAGWPAVFAVCGALAACFLAPLPRELVRETVTVGPGGGSADVTFRACRGWTVRIDLVATDATMEPYGFLECPESEGVYQPPNEGATAGGNGADVSIDHSCTYTLTVFDGTNQGGTVEVIIQRIE